MRLNFLAPCIPHSNIKFTVTTPPYASFQGCHKNRRSIYKGSMPWKCKSVRNAGCCHWIEEKCEMTAIGVTVITLGHKSQWQRDGARRHKRYADEMAITGPLQALSLDYGLWENCDGDIFRSSKRKKWKWKHKTSVYTILPKLNSLPAKPIIV